MDFDFVRNALGLMVRQGLSVLDLKHEGGRLRMERSIGHEACMLQGSVDLPVSVSENLPVVGLRKKEPAPQERQVQAPMTGVIHLMPKPGDPCFVEVGSQVFKGEQIAIIEAMKTFTPINAPCDGIVRNILIRNGDEVTGGDGLFMIQAIGGEN